MWQQYAEPHPPTTHTHAAQWGCTNINFLVFILHCSFTYNFTIGGNWAKGAWDLSVPYWPLLGDLELFQGKKATMTVRLESPASEYSIPSSSANPGTEMCSVNMSGRSKGPLISGPPYPYPRMRPSTDLQWQHVHTFPVRTFHCLVSMGSCLWNQSADSPPSC